ncbi:MAG: putative glycolipid-binding domain-containing protein [Pseudolabrys sp.]|nr:putative glycolipid-binding domain-containing protein [Pseudolabrys sp.]
MAKPISALWKRLDVPGHDAASFVQDGAGWRLSGTAVFQSEVDGRPVAAMYEVLLDAQYHALSGAIRGVNGHTPFSHDIVRNASSWHLDGRVQDLGDIVDLDFGFTPATNLPQLKRINLAIGEAAAFDVAWFDITESKLIALPQLYRRVEQRRYAYESPQGPYAATLEIAESGFVASYPDLWAIEPH